VLERIKKFKYKEVDYGLNTKLPYISETGTASQPASSRYKVIKSDSEDLGLKWEEYALKHPQAHIYDHPSWFKALEHEYNRKGCVLVCLDNSDNIKGVLPLMPTIGLPFKLGDLITTRRYSSLPRTPLGGMLTDDDKVKEALISEAIKRVESREKTFLQLKSYSPDLNINIDDLQQIPWRSSYFVKLPEDPEKIRFGNKKSHHKVKWGVNKAKKLGITVREAKSTDDLKRWYKLYLETMRWHVVAARPFIFFEFLFQNLRKKGLMTMLLAELDKNGQKQLLTGSLFLHFNKIFFYSFNGRCRSGLACHANDLLQWEAIHLAAKIGYQLYDMGEVSCNNKGLAQFKTKWGCCTKPVYHYYYPINQRLIGRDIDISWNTKLRKLIWRRIPLSVTMHWGILTNRFL
jgi:hypothetical protein